MSRMRVGGALWRALLVLALSAGVALMHTIGHVEGGTHSATNAPQHAATTNSNHAAADAPERMTLDGSGRAAMDWSGRAAALESTALESTAVWAADMRAVDAVSTAMTGLGGGVASDESGLGMDMASLCLAVLLAAWVLAALLWVARAHRPGWMAKLLARPLIVQRSNAPPRRPDLSQLSVLRL